MRIAKIREKHRLLALWLVLPFGFISLTGCLLQLKSWIGAIQPKSYSSAVGPLETISAPSSWADLLAAAKGVPEAKVEGWADVASVDIKPKLGVARLRTKSNYEVQLDLSNAKILSAAPRYTSLLVSLHEGSFFGDALRLVVFIPASIALLFLNFSGACLLKQYYRRGVP